MSSVGASFQQGLVLLVFYTVGRVAESAANFAVCYISSRALFYNDSVVVCPDGMSDFVWFVMLFSACVFAKNLRELSRSGWRSERTMMIELGAQLAASALVMIVTGVYFFRKCDQVLSNVVTAYFVLQGCTVVWISVCLVAMSVLCEPDTAVRPPTPRPRADEVCRDCEEGHI
jgi:hypothetical protein